MTYCFKTGKLTYASRQEASGAVRRVNRRRRSARSTVLSVYRCEFCHLFHLGRDPR